MFFDEISTYVKQVSHHPPIGASNATSPHFDFFEEQGVKSKFGGNSLNIETIGMRQLTLKKKNDQYTWGGIKTTAHNILLGEMWVDHYGRAEITCPTNSEYYLQRPLRNLKFRRNHRHLRVHQMWLVQQGKI